jgi:hypothetical protein
VVNQTAGCDAGASGHGSSLPASAKHVTERAASLRPLLRPKMVAPADRSKQRCARPLPSL